MSFYAIVDTIGLIALLAAAILTAAGYARWHFWWRSAFGRGFMAILLAFAGRTPHQILSLTDPGANENLFDVLEGISIIATYLAALALTYFLYATIALNIRRARLSKTALVQDYLERTPWATPAQIKVLTDCWEDVAAHSDASTT